ncbi:MAG: thermonuclease family protein [Flavisolibacter sp.]|nr:thermonuclease family protein [Flavisolibacter sp.]
MHSSLSRIYRKLFCIGVAIIVSFSCSGPDMPSAKGKVVAIADGDTFTFLDKKNMQVKIRLYGVDCPERSQEFGTVARQKLSDLIFGQPVKLVEKGTDQYGRTIAMVYTPNNVCVNEELLRNGLAWHYKEYDKNSRWAQLEEIARRNKVGLWSQPHPTPPWEWRKEKRMKQMETAK